MVPTEWAGHPLLRPILRLMGYRPKQPWRDTQDARPLILRRVLLLVLVALGAAIGTDYMIDILPRHGHGWAERGLIVLFGILFAWISAGFWTALMGTWVLMLGRDRRSVTGVLRGDGAKVPIAADARTAVIMPICNEHVPTVFAGLRATIESLGRTDSADCFDFFVLSDTNDPEARVAEQAAWTRLTRALEQQGTAARVHYRWRQIRTRRKAGNVADFCRRFGADYRYMVVLDADSVMTGDCLASLARMMETHPDAGIIQTAPRACGHETLHARIVQFSSRVYGPLFTTGMHFWQLGESHYWGHNAILRMAPFIAHCALAPLHGKTSLSGDVMSHDFVEAALMRRAGWKVWIAHDLEGSYEQVPPNLLAELQRDQRWAHGNLQNSRLMFEPGLHPVHRTVFLTGVLAYVSAPLWLAFLLLSTVLFASHSHAVPRYFLEPYQLFPVWPNANVKLMLTLFGLTGVLLLAPKALSLAVIVLRGQARRFGGVSRLLIGALFEFLHSLLLAPVRMLFHTQFVLAALTGVKLDWKSPPRDDAVTPWGQALRRHGLHTLLAVGWIAAILLSSAVFPWWLSPVLLGLLVAIPLSAWTSHAGPGRWLRARSVFLIPEEARQPAVLAEADRYAEWFDALPTLADAVADESAHAEVLDAIPWRRPALGAKAGAQAALVELAARAGPGGLSKAELLRVLADADTLRALRASVIARRAHADWWKSPRAQSQAMSPLTETARTQVETVAAAH
jgi:membrane glycosyltransferase